MRWDDLFADLQAQADAEADRERAAEVDELTRAEVAQIALLDRIRPSVGAVVNLTVRGDVSVAGVLRRTGADWLLVDEDAGDEALVPLAAIVAVRGLGRLSAMPSTSPVDAGFGLARALRGIARDRSPVRLHLIEGPFLTGTVDRVGRDFLELGPPPGEEQRRSATITGPLVVAQSALTTVRRAPSF